MALSRITRLTAMWAIMSLTLPAVAAPKKPARKPAPSPTAEAPATKPADDVTKVKVPAEINGIAVGGGGRYLILYLRKLQQLAVYDATQTKVVKYIPLPSNEITLAAGASKLFIGMKDLKQIQRWDLAKLEREVTVPAPEGGIVDLAMGANAEGPLLLAGEKRWWQIDPVTMQATKVPSKHWGNDGGAWGPTNLYVSYDGTTAIATGGGWAGMELCTIAGGKVVDVHGGGRLSRSAVVSGDGQLIFADGTSALRNDLTSKIEGLAGASIPAYDASFSLSLKRDKNKATVTIFSNSDPRPLLTMNNLGELDVATPKPLMQRVFLIPKHKTLITTNLGAGELFVRKFDLIEALNARGTDYLFVESTPPSLATRTAPIAYPVKVLSKKGGVKLELQAGPPGMTLDPTGKLSWTVPPTFSDPTAAVIIGVSDASGQSIFHSFVLKVAPPAAAPPTAVATGPKAEPMKPKSPAVAVAPPSRTPAPPPTTVTPPAGIKPRTPQPAVIDPKATPATPAPATMPTAPAGTPANPIVVKLDEPFAEYHAANGGNTLVFYQPKARQLAIYEMATGKSLGVIRLNADNVRFACGNDVIVAALTDQRIMQTYSIKTLQKLKTAPLPSTKPLKEMKMGTASAGPVYLYFGGEMIIVDAATLAPMKIRGELPSGDPNWRFTYRISADGSTLVSWDPYASPSHFYISRLRGTTLTTVKSPEAYGMANRRFTPTADGSFVMYETKVYNAAAKAVDSNLKEYQNLVPTSDPRFIIAVRETKLAGNEGRKPENWRSDLAICTAGDRRILTSLNAVSSIGHADHDAGRVGICFDMPGVGEPRAVYRADSKTLALIPGTNDRFELIRLDLSGGIAGATSPAGTPAVGGADAMSAIVSLPPNEVAVGGTYSYQIQVLPQKPKTTYKIESGPQGLTVSPTGLVTWKVTERPIGGKANVILSVVDAGGNELPHAFEIAVVRSAAPAAVVPGQPAPGTIVKADERRIELPSKEVRYTLGLAGRGLILSGDQFAVVAPDGFTIVESRSLAKSYTAIAERKDYYVALCKEPRAIELLNKKTFEVIKSRPIVFESLLELVLHPTLPISYVSYRQPTDKPSHHFLIFNERTADARTDDNWIGNWMGISPDGEFLMTGFQETYQKGHDIIDNPDRIWIVPAYGSIDTMARYDLTAGGMPMRVSSRQGVGTNGQGLRLSADGTRVVYLSFAGYPSMSGNLGAWNPLDLKQLPISYMTKDVASCKELAFHPLLPLAVSPGKNGIVFFDRETGQTVTSKINDEELVGQTISTLHFSPDGKTLIAHTTVDGVDYLLHVPLKLTADEVKALGAMPRPDKPQRVPANNVPPPPPGAKLPQV